MKLSIKLKWEKDYSIKLTTFVMPLVKHNFFSDAVWGSDSKRSGMGPIPTASTIQKEFFFFIL